MRYNNFMIIQKGKAEKSEKQEVIMKNILFASSECVPFIKTGGLADVVGSLPKYFDKDKYDVRVVLQNIIVCFKMERYDGICRSFYMELAGEDRYVGIMTCEYGDSLLLYR